MLLDGPYGRVPHTAAERSWAAREQMIEAEDRWEAISHGESDPALPLGSLLTETKTETDQETKGDGMTTELSVYERCENPLIAVREMGTAIAKSRMFGCESIEQGMVFAWECFARRCSPLSLTETYHVIDGKLAMRSDAMLAGFIAIGGTHEIVERTENRAAVRLQIGNQSCVFTLTWEEAHAEGLADGKKGVKTNWSTPRRRMQMLWARVVSDGVRAMAPQVCCGRYTPEDLGHAEDEEDDRQPPERIESTLAATTTAKIETAAVTPAAESPQPKPATMDEITPEQKLRLQELVKLLDAHDALAAGLKRRKVSSINSLTAGQAAEIIAKLEAKATKIKDATTEATDVAGESSQSPEATTETLTGPATPEQIARAKQLIAELEQSRPGTAKKIKDKLQSAGKQKIAELTFHDCRELLSALEIKQMENFFALSLSLHVGSEADEIPF